MRINTSKIYTTGDVAKLFDVSTNAVKLWVKLGKVEPIKTNSGRSLFTDKMIAELTEKRAQK